MNRFLKIGAATLAALCVGGAAASPAAARSAKALKRPPEAPKVAPDRLIVRYRSEAASGMPANRFQAGPAGIRSPILKLQSLNHRFRLQSMRRVQLPSAPAAAASRPMSGGTARDRLTAKIRKDMRRTFVLSFSASGTRVEDLVKAYKADPNVEYAEPDYIYEKSTVPNDPYLSSSNSWGQGYADLWDMQKIQAPAAWALNTGTGVIVAVVDTGLDYNHPDISANALVRPGSDFTTCGGFDFFGFSCLVPKSRGDDPVDQNGHGTHVAGTIAAVGNNALGIIGVAFKSQILPVKALSPEGMGYVSDLSDAVIYAADQGARVINCSWGGGGNSTTMANAFAYAHAKGAVIVAAAGNSGVSLDSYPEYPAVYPEVVTVAASDVNDVKADFSNYGSKIDVTAPGGNSTTYPTPPVEPYYNILSLKATTSYLALELPELVVNTNYMRLAGTSMAAPHVAGVAALILSQHPDYTNEQVRQVLRQSADDVETPGWDTNSGYGRINALHALQSPTPLRVEITSPAPDDGLAASQPILGTVAGPNFAGFVLEYSTAPTGVYQAIGQTQTSPVTNGLLGTWNTTGLADGTYSLRLRAWDNAGRISNYDLYPLYVDHTPPVISAWNLAGGMILAGTQPVIVLSSDNLHLATIQLSVDGQQRISQAASGADLLYWDTRKESLGTHTVTVTVADDARLLASTSAVVSIVSDNTPPGASVLQGTDGATQFIGPSAIARGIDRRVHALWAVTTLAGASSTDDLIYGVSSDGGKTWSKETIVSQNAYVESLALAIDSKGQPHALWAQSDGTGFYNTNVMVSSRPAAGWQTPVLLGVKGSNVSLAIDSKDNVHAFWVSQIVSGTTGASNDLEYAARLGGLWQAANSISTAPGIQVSPQAAVDRNDVLHVAWELISYTNGATQGIQYRQRSGSGWQPQETVTPDPWQVVLKVDEAGQPHVVWYSYLMRAADFLEAINHAQRTAGGWSPVENLVSASTPLTSYYSALGYPSLSTDASGQVLAAWPERLGMSYDTFGRTRSSSGWAAEKRLTTTAVAIEAFASAYGPGTATLQPGRPKTGYAMLGYSLINGMYSLAYFPSSDLTWDRDPLVILSTGLPAGRIGQSYAAALSATGGQAPYSWSISSGALPVGLSISTSGAISGTPAAAGIADLTFQVTDVTSSSATKTLQLAIRSGVTISITPLGKVLGPGQQFQFTTFVSGSTNTAVTWSLTTNGTGTIAQDGTYSAPAVIASSQSVGVLATSVADPTQSALAVVTLMPGLTITSTDLPPGIVGRPYAASLAASGGLGPYAWSIVSGALPAGLSISTSGVIGGTPAAAGDSNLVVQVQDRLSAAATAAFSITIGSVTVSLPAPTFSLAPVLPLNARISAAYPPGIPVWVFNWTVMSISPARGAVTASTADPWLDLSSLALLPGTYQITITAQDSVGNLSPSASATTQLKWPALVLNLPSTLPLNGTIDLTLPSNSPYVSFTWDFAPASGSAGSASTGAPARVTGSTINANSPHLNLAAYSLQAGSYLLTVTATDASGNASLPAQASVALVSIGLNDVTVRPSPWRSNLHSGKDITFGGLPTGSQVKIFTISGRWVATVHEANGEAAWNLKTDGGDSVASGIYLFVVNDGQGGKVHGKFGVIR